MNNRLITFVATGRSGLGHLRRTCTIAGATRRLSPHTQLLLLTNAEPIGLSDADLTAFSKIVIADRSDMARRLDSLRSDIAVLDTISVPGLERCRQNLILILRETSTQGLASFVLGGSRRWDEVIIPNPRSHWMPSVDDSFAQCLTAVGWIYRYSGPRDAQRASAGLVLATGGGGNAQTRERLYGLVSELIVRVRRRFGQRFFLRQALGPRAGAEDGIECADELFVPGAKLHDIFRQADLVISTAGYNSVLELATTDTPTLLVSIPRTYDDQAGRAHRWGALLGASLHENYLDDAVSWLVDQLEHPRRRATIDLGTSGEMAAAKRILGLV